MLGTEERLLTLSGSGSGDSVHTSSQPRYLYRVRSMGRRLSRSFHRAMISPALLQAGQSPFSIEEYDDDLSLIQRKITPLSAVASIGGNTVRAMPITEAPLKSFETDGSQQT